MAHWIRLVDDNQRTRAAMRRLLERHGLRVREAAPGAAAGDADEADVVIVEEEQAASAAGEPQAREPAPNDHEWMQSLMADDEAYERMLPELLQRYEGQYVALYRGELIGVAKTAKQAALRGIEALGRPEALFVARVGEPRPEPLELGMWIGAPRQVVIEE